MLAMIFVIAATSILARAIVRRRRSGPTAPAAARPPLREHRADRRAFR